MQTNTLLVDGVTLFDNYPEVINNMYNAARSDFSGEQPPQDPIVGQTYFNTTEKKRYRYDGQENGWILDTANLLNEVNFFGKPLEDALIKMASQNAGNTFPTGVNGVWVGMPCYRKDLNAIYVCTEYDPTGQNHTWTDITNLSPIFENLKNEILTARGTASSLSARLDVALNHDGTLKGTAPAGEWWEPVTPYQFTKTDTSVLTFNDEGDYTALFEVDRAVLLHPSHNKAYVVSSAYDEKTNKTSVTIDEEIGEDTQIQFGAPVGNSSKIIIPNATDTIYGLIRITDQVRDFDNIPVDENKVPTEKAAANAIATKLDKSAISSALDRDSEETVLSSLGAKMLNEKIINNKKVTLLEERTAIGNVTLTGVEVGKPIFILSSQPTVNSMAYAYMSCLSGSLDGIVPNSTITSIYLGLQSGNYSTNIACVIPNQDTVVFNISVMTGGYIVRFYQ